MDNANQAGNQGSVFTAHTPILYTLVIYCVDIDQV